MDDFEKRYDNMIRTTWFQDHVASLHSASIGPNTQGKPPARSSMQFLKWAKPGSSIYSVYYIIYGPNLMVFGDVDSSVYRWPQDISFEFLGKCHYTYFAKKCESSEIGRRGEQWFEERCKEQLKNHLSEHASYLLDGDEAISLLGLDEYADKPSWESLSESQQDKLINYYIFLKEFARYHAAKNLMDGFEDSLYAIINLRDSFNEACVSEFTWGQCLQDNPNIFSYEYECHDWGYDVAISCRAHLIGIQMAMEQVEKQRKDFAEQEVPLWTIEQVEEPVQILPKPMLVVWWKWLKRRFRKQ